MKLKLVFLITASFLFLISCTHSETPQLEEYEVSIASGKIEAPIKSYMKKLENTNSYSSSDMLSVPKSFLKKSFLNGEIYKVKHNHSGKLLYSVMNPENPGLTISFTLGADGEITRPFMSKTVKNQDGSFDNHFYSLEGNEFLAFRDYQDGTRVRLEIDKPIQPKSTIIDVPKSGWWSDWWDEADDCVGDFHNLTDSNIANNAINTIV